MQIPQEGQVAIDMQAEHNGAVMTKLLNIKMPSARAHKACRSQPTELCAVAGDGLAGDPMQTPQEGQTAIDMQAAQENLVPAGFAGTVAQAYMSLNYV